MLEGQLVEIGVLGGKPVLNHHGRAACRTVTAYDRTITGAYGMKSHHEPVL